ncbi:MAG: sugar phosphate isomerase/epimerase family protein [Candidatus Nanohaloarchaea archaeon]
MRTGMAINPEDDFVEALEEVPDEFDFVEVAIGEMEKEPSGVDVEAWREGLEGKGLDLVIHLPFRQPLATTVEEYNRAKVEYIRGLLDLCQELGAEKAVLHSNTRYGEEKEDVRDTLRNQIELIDTAAGERGVEIVVENIPFEDTRIADLVEFGELVRDSGASVCLDTGHAFAEAGQEELEEFAGEFSGIISHLHVQDSRGGDDHIAVGHGDIDFESFARALGDFTGTACFEIFSPDYDYHQLSREKFLQHF